MKGDLKVLMVSTDRNILQSGSAVTQRMKDYGGLVKELHILLLCDKKHGLREEKLSENVFIHPTNSINKFLRPFDALGIGKKINVTLITTQDPFECGWVGFKLKKKLRVPLEVQLHTDPFSEQFGGVLNFIRKRLARRILKVADGIRVVSESLATKISYPRTYVLPIYVDKSRINNDPKFDLHEKYGFKQVVLVVSRLAPEKNLSLAIKVAENLPSAGMVVVGDGPERKKFKETDKIKFVGWQDDLSSYYKTADIYIQTSKYEGYGLSLVEAGLCGLPVVSTPVGVANDLGNVKIAKSLGDFLSTISSLMEDEPGRRTLGQRLKQELEAEIYTKEAYLVKLKENWTNLLSI